MYLAIFIFYFYVFIYLCIASLLLVLILFSHSFLSTKFVSRRISLCHCYTSFLQWWGFVYLKKMDPYLLRTWFYIIFLKTFLSVSKISKTPVYFLGTSGEYSKRYGQGSIFTTDPCPYLVKYSLDVFKKKTKVLDIFNTDKKCFIKI